MILLMDFRSCIPNSTRNRLSHYPRQPISGTNLTGPRGKPAMRGSAGVTASSSGVAASRRPTCTSRTPADSEERVRSRDPLGIKRRSVRARGGGERRRRERAGGARGPGRGRRGGRRRRAGRHRGCPSRRPAGASAAPSSAALAREIAAMRGFLLFFHAKLRKNHPRATADGTI